MTACSVVVGTNVSKFHNTTRRPNPEDLNLK